MGDRARADEMEQRRDLLLINQPLTLRTCLGPCDRMFYSSDRGHRMCNHCAGKNRLTGSLFGEPALSEPKRDLRFRQFRDRGEA